MIALELGFTTGKLLHQKVKEDIWRLNNLIDQGIIQNGAVLYFYSDTPVKENTRRWVKIRELEAQCYQEIRANITNTKEPCEERCWF